MEALYGALRAVTDTCPSAVCTFLAPDGSSYALVIPESESSYYAHVRQSGAFDEVPRLLWHSLGPEAVLVDVGANLGAVAIPLAAKGATVLAIEALPQNVALLKAATRHNTLRDFRVFHKAAWSAPTTLRVGGFEAWGQIDPTGTVEVDAIRLDDFVKEHGLKHVDAVKLDIEGAELAALAGMRRMLDVEGPDVVIEANVLTCGAFGYSIHELFRVLEGHGYDLFRLAGYALIPFATNGFQETLVCDYLATKRAGDLATRVGPWHVGPLPPEPLIALMKAMAAHGADHKRYMAHIDLPADFTADRELMALREEWRSEALHAPGVRAIEIGSRKV